MWETCSLVMASTTATVSSYAGCSLFVEISAVLSATGCAPPSRPQVSIRPFVEARSSSSAVRRVVLMPVTPITPGYPAEKKCGWCRTRATGAEMSSKIMGEAPESEGRA